MYLLDTNVISELRRAGDRRADANVMAWVGAVPSSLCYISVITAMEVEIGIGRLERRDEAQGQRLRDWFESRVLTEFASRTLPVDTAVARTTARLHVPEPRGERDALIAATGLVHGMAVVTRNVGDFAATGVRTIDPWALGSAGTRT